jgi:hypothetical protein
MKTIKIIALFAATLSIGLISSCSKDDSTNSTTTTDARDLVIGNYSGIEISTDASDSTDSDTVLFTISKGAGTSLIINQDGVSINTSAVVVAGKDLAGNIPTQTLTVDGVSFSIQGRGNNNEHFGFMESTKAFTYDFQVNDGPLAGYKVMVFGTKK